jgi:hypothetical protein
MSGGTYRRLHDRAKANGGFGMMGCMSNFPHAGGHDSHSGASGDPHHGHRGLDDATRTKIYQTRDDVYQLLHVLQDQLHHLPDHNDWDALLQCQESLERMAVCVGLVAAYLGDFYTYLPIYWLSYNFNNDAYVESVEWRSKYEHGDAEAVRLSAEKFLTDFTHQFEQGFAGL